MKRHRDAQGFAKRSIDREWKGESPPTVIGYVRAMCDSFIELRGDRQCSDDLGIVGGYAKICGHSVVVVAHDPSRVHDWGYPDGSVCPNLNGYRKAARLMRLAEKFRHPLLIVVMAPTSLSGIGAEEPSEAVALVQHLYVMGQLVVPTVLVVLGHWGYGDVFGVWGGDRILTSEHGCFAMRYLDRQLRLSHVFVKAQDLEARRIVDCVLPDPIHGADALEVMGAWLRERIGLSLGELVPLTFHQLMLARAERADRVAALIGGL